MHRLPRFVPSLAKIAQVASANVPSASAAPLAGAAVNPNTLPSAPMRRDYGTRFASDMLKLFRQAEKSPFINYEHAQAILDKADPAALEPRDASNPPSREGLLAVIAYTSNGMLAAQVNDALAGKKIPTCSARENAELEKLGHAIMETISRLKPVPVETAYRNTALDAEALAQYSVGSAIAIDRLTSVTLGAGQAYTGGNVDFVFHPKNGVVSVAALSEYQRENEGLLIPDQDRRWVVDKIEDGQEGQRLAQDPENYPPKTIHLREA